MTPTPLDYRTLATLPAAQARPVFRVLASAFALFGLWAVTVCIHAIVYGGFWKLLPLAAVEVALTSTAMKIAITGRLWIAAPRERDR